MEKMKMNMDLDNLAPSTGCQNCGGAEMRERLLVEQVPYGDDGLHLDVEVPVVECPACNFSYTDHRAEGLRHAAACRHEGLLTPEEVRTIRAELGMSRREFSLAFGIPPASLERWENGRLMQNTSLDTLLRALQNQATAARLDRRRHPDRPRGEAVVARFRALEATPKALEDARERGNGFRLRVVSR